MQVRCNKLMKILTSPLDLLPMTEFKYSCQSHPDVALLQGSEKSDTYFAFKSTFKYF